MSTFLSQTVGQECTPPTPIPTLRKEQLPSTFTKRSTTSAEEEHGVPSWEREGVKRCAYLQTLPCCQDIQVAITLQHIADQATGHLLLLPLGAQVHCQRDAGGKKVQSLLGRCRAYVKIAKGDCNDSIGRCGDDTLDPLCGRDLLMPQLQARAGGG
jgi:hypothetical protein